MREALRELSLTRRQKAAVALAFAMCLAAIGIAFIRLAIELPHVGSPL